jgi:hypothetical protein
MVGDYNIDILKHNSSDSKKFSNILESYNYSYRNVLPTRNKACLDNILVPNDFCNFACGTFAPGLSDHLGLWALCFIPVSCKSSTNTNIDAQDKYRPLQIRHIMNLRNYLSQLNYRELVECNHNISCIWTKFVKMLQVGIQTFCPLAYIKHKAKNTLSSSPWYTSELRNMRKNLLLCFDLSKSGSVIMLAKYNKMKKAYRNELLRAKRKYHDTIIMKSTNKNTAAWNIIKKESSNKERNKLIPLSAQDFGDYLKKQKSNLTLKRNIALCQTDRRQLYLNNLIIDPKVKFQFSEIKPASVVLIVKRLKASKSEDIFGLSTYLLKHIVDLFYEPLCDLINMTLAQGIFPEILKETIIIPIYKKGDRFDPSNYRQIALAPILSKVLESVMKEQFLCFLERNHIINKCQFGFRSGFGTTDAVMEIVSRIYNNLESHNITAALLLDISKAFDSISHNILLEKMHYYGIQGNDLKLFDTFVSNRKQYIKIKNEFFGPIESNKGVPQGSILGPLLFVLYMNDFHTALKSSPILYADDTTILTSNVYLDKLNLEINLELAEANLWLDCNELELNVNKTEQIYFSLNKKITLRNNNKVIKLLGLHLNDTLSWKDHIDHISNKLATNLYLLRRLKNNVTDKCIRLAYYAFYHSHISYGIILWGSAPGWKDVFVWQKKAIRLLAGIKQSHSCRGQFKRLGILTVPSLFCFHAIVHVKIHLSDFLTRSGIHSYNTRNSHLLDKPKHSLSIHQRSYKIYGVTLFNLLPLNMRNSPIKRFKSDLKKYLIQCEGYSWVEIENYLKNLSMK